MTVCCFCAAVSSVLSVNHHTLSDVTIHVSALQPQPPPSLILNESVDETRLLAKKLPPGCSRDELQTFLGRASAPRIHCWRIGVKPTTALLDFVSAPGLLAVLQHVTVQLMRRMDTSVRCVMPGGTKVIVVPNRMQIMYNS